MSLRQVLKHLAWCCFRREDAILVHVDKQFCPKPFDDLVLGFFLWMIAQQVRLHLDAVCHQLQHVIGPSDLQFRFTQHGSDNGAVVACTGAFIPWAVLFDHPCMSMDTCPWCVAWNL